MFLIVITRPGALKFTHMLRSHSFTNLPSHGFIGPNIG